MTDSKTATELLADMRDELLESCEYIGTMTERQGDVMRILGKYEQAIAATLGNNRENELQAALNKVAGKWAKAQIEAEDYAKENLLLKAKLETATLGSGECEIKQHRCTNCDHEINDKAYFVSIDLGDGLLTADSRRANYCPNCGRKVKQ